MRTILSLSVFVLLGGLVTSCNLKLVPPVPDKQQQTIDGSLLPLAVGRTWRYQVVQLGTGASLIPCPAGIQTESVITTSSTGNQNAYHVLPVCSNAGVVYYSVNGNEVDQYANYRWQPYLSAPVQEDRTWFAPNGQYIWNSEPSVSTKAGNFSNCWRRSQINTSMMAYETYCFGVGKVVSHFQDTWGNGWDAQLIQKAF